MKKILVFIVLFGFSMLAQATVVVLVHGYLSTGEVWHKEGIIQQLDFHLPNTAVYTPTLPYKAPILEQAEVLKNALLDVKAKHKDEKIILIGHSAGGVVARAYLVLSQDTQVKALFTIASPHLGTDRSDIANVLSRVPVLKSITPLERSRGLFFDLSVINKSFLGQLNLLPHPNIYYVSLIRSSAIPFGDFVVSPYSQNMHFIPALQGKAVMSLVTPGGHFIHPRDGVVLIGLLLPLI